MNLVFLAAVPSLSVLGRGCRKIGRYIVCISWRRRHFITLRRRRLHQSYKNLVVFLFSRSTWSIDIDLPVPSGPTRYMTLEDMSFNLEVMNWFMFWIPSSRPRIPGIESIVDNKLKFKSS